VGPDAQKKDVLMINKRNRRATIMLLFIPLVFSNLLNEKKESELFIPGNFIVNDKQKIINS